MEDSIGNQVIHDRSRCGVNNFFLADIYNPTVHPGRYFIILISILSDKIISGCNAIRNHNITRR